MLLGHKQEKPETIKTHLRDMIIVPEMIGSVVGVYNGKTFNQVEVRVCHMLGKRRQTMPTAGLY
jgi:small subunit ribosomal protein S15e